MPSVTLAESAKLSQDMLVQGVIESVITVDRFFDVLPFAGIEGNSLAYNRENALGDVQFGTVGSTITAKAAATFTQVTSSLTTIVGDAEVNGLVQATRSNINDQKAVQVASKAKSAGRQYRDTLINGDGTGNSFNGLLDLVDAGQVVGANDGGINGGDYDLDDLDNLIDQVIDKDGEVDYLIMHSRSLRSYFSILRGLGGASIGEVVRLPGGAEVPAYRGIPIFRNDWMPTDQTKGSLTTATSIIAGTLDDGSMTVGISGLTAMDQAGLFVEEVGIHQDRDETITRVKWYTGLALFNLNGLAVMDGVAN